jgi:hypothetical protein
MISRSGMRGKPAGRWGQLSRIERTELSANTAGMAIRINRLAAGFVVLAQPVKAPKPTGGRRFGLRNQT